MQGRYVVKELRTIEQFGHWVATVEHRGIWRDLNEIYRETGATLVSTYPHEGKVMAVFLTLPDEV